jgi:hypothetical protein
LKSAAQVGSGGAKKVLEFFFTLKGENWTSTKKSDET